MKILTLSRSKLDLARGQLTKPMMLIGRSPTCDIILRAPGIEPIHFIIEWLGSGKFDSEQGMWSVTDVSRSEDDSSGVVLGVQPIKIGDLQFRIAESQLESSEILGGTIQGSLQRKQYAAPELVEFVQVRSDSGAIEEVTHLPLKASGGRPRPMSREFREFKVQIPKGSAEQVAQVILEEMPGAELLLSGKKVNPEGVVSIRATDLLRVKWKGRDFYLRFVEQVESPHVPHDFWGSKLLRNSTIGGLLLALLLLGIAHFGTRTEEEKVPEPPRIARVEIPATPPPPPPPTPPPPTQEVAKSAPEVVIKNLKTKAASTAVAPKVVKAPEAPVKAGLNSKAPVTNVNQIGLLGALSKSAGKGQGVKADQLMNEAVIHESVTNQSDAQVIMKTPEAGVLGKGGGGNPNSKQSEKTLGAASTTLSGANKVDPNSTGLLARKGGESGFKLGAGQAGLSNSGAGAGRGLGNLEGGEFSVAGGGLDRETVRKIINSYKSQVRTCYERALIASPNFEGRVSYKWTITPSGPVVSAHIHKETVQSASLKACVLEVIQGMKFPASTNGLPTTVIYPFVFQGKR